MVVLFYPAIREALLEEVMLSRDMMMSPEHWCTDPAHTGS